MNSACKTRTWGKAKCCWCDVNCCGNAAQGLALGKLQPWAHSNTAGISLNITPLSLCTSWFSPNLSDHQSPHFTYFLKHENSNEIPSSAAFTWAWDKPPEIKGLLFQFVLHYFCKEIVLAEAMQMLNLLQAVKIHRNWKRFLPWLLHCFTQGRMTRGQKQCRNRSLWPT